jgi:DNA helicase-2/ATP-dependent DNA helicase PcrA
MSWSRILRLISHIGQAKSNAIMEWMRKNQIPPAQVGDWSGGVNEKKDLKKLGQLLSDLSVQDVSPTDAIELVITYYTPLLKQKFDDYPRRQRELEQLISMASRYKKLRGFLDDLILEPPTSPADLDLDRKGERLTLSTVHSAKGLEWPVVFIIWVTEGRFPAARSYSSTEGIEEERRLMYVAATRARDQLVMCYPSQESAAPWQLGQGRGRAGLSSFVQALPEEVASHDSAGRPARISYHGSLSQQGMKSSAGPQGSKIDFPGFSQGDRVNHPAFGPGVVSKLVKGDKVEVLFRNFGRKLLHMAYTTLEKV